MNWFSDNFNTRLGYVSNYSATANLHNSQITTASAKPFPVCCVFNSRSLVTVPNSGDFFSFTRWSPFFTDSCTELSSNLVPAYNISAQNNTENTAILLLHSCVAAGTCLPRRCPETALVYPPIPRSLHSNGSTLYNIFSMLVFWLCMKSSVPPGIPWMGRWEVEYRTAGLDYSTHKLQIINCV
jgi:hypothetical protein